MFNKGLKMLLGLAAIGLMIGMPTMTQARPGAKVLITDTVTHKVLEVDPTTDTIVWEYGGRGVLNSPDEAIPLTNGNILIADTGNQYLGTTNSRIIEVNPSKQVVWEYKPGTQTLFYPQDIRRCVDYTTGVPRDSLLITDGVIGKVMEITYPGGALIWEFGKGDVSLMRPYEAEKRPGTGTPTYLITDTWNQRVIEVQRTSPNDGIITWQYGQTGMAGSATNYLNGPVDAEWTPCGNVLIADEMNKRLIEVQPNYPTGGTIIWDYQSATTTFVEATRIENGNTLIAGRNDPPNKGVVYEITPTKNVDWWYTTLSSDWWFDVEEKGIINIAKIEYENMQGEKMKRVLAGVVVPIYQPEIVYVGTPTIVATKTVSPEGAQRPGAVLTYKIELQNAGNGTATQVVVTDRVPEGTEYVFDSDTPEANVFSHDGGQNYDASETMQPITHIRWDIGNLEPMETRILEFKVMIK